MHEDWRWWLRSIFLVCFGDNQHSWCGFRIDWIACISVTVPFLLLLPFITSLRGVFGVYAVWCYREHFFIALYYSLLFHDCNWKYIGWIPEEGWVCAWFSSFQYIFTIDYVSISVMLSLSAPDRVLRSKVMFDSQMNESSAQRILTRRLASNTSDFQQTHTVERLLVHSVRGGFDFYKFVLFIQFMLRCHLFHQRNLQIWRTESHNIPGGMFCLLSLLFLHISVLIASIERYW